MPVTTASAAPARCGIRTTVPFRRGCARTGGAPLTLAPTSAPDAAQVVTDTGFPTHASRAGARMPKGKLKVEPGRKTYATVVAGVDIECCMAWAELSDVRCYYEVVGEGDPVLFVAGLGGNCRVWDPVIPYLAQEFSCILTDNRGLGRSVARRKPRTLADYSADMAELLDKLQLERAHVLGLSLGGIIAQRFAIDHPSRVDRLVLVSCAERFTAY